MQGENINGEQLDEATRIAQGQADEVRQEMVGEIVDGKALINGENCFADVSSLEALSAAFAGFASMCWEFPEKAGVLQTEEVNAGLMSFMERATDIIWTRIYSHLNGVLAESHPDLSQEQKDGVITSLVQGMDLWA